MTLTTQQRGWNGGRIRDAGFAPGSDDRIPRHAEAKVKAGEANRAARPPISSPSRDQVVSSDIVEAGLRKLGLHLAAGAFEQAKQTIDAIERDWKIDKQQRAAWGQATADTLAIHVSQILDPRTANLVEIVCRGTVGSLVECFPEAFLDVPMCGPHAIEKIAQALCRIGVLTAEESQRRMERYADALKLDERDKKNRYRMAEILR